MVVSKASGTNLHTYPEWLSHNSHYLSISGHLNTIIFDIWNRIVIIFFFSHSCHIDLTPAEPLPMHYMLGSVTFHSWHGPTPPSAILWRINQCCEFKTATPHPSNPKKISLYWVILGSELQNISTVSMITALFNSFCLNYIFDVKLYNRP